MEIDYTKERIKFEKELNSLDRFTLDFTSILNKLNIRYVIVSGYVSILFGRSRSSEDIDMIIEKLELPQFKKLWTELSNRFECLITNNVIEAYNDYLITGHAIRFSKKSKFMPNMEIKFPKSELDVWAVAERREVIVNNSAIYISPIELQISYKLFLGSEKDIEDAKHLYKIFRNKLNISLLNHFNQKLNIKDTFDTYIR
jgi:hypothetical protein